MLTHDVDAIEKKKAVRLKQALCLFNKQFKRALKFLFGPGNYQFEQIMSLEKLHGRTSIWNFMAEKAASGDPLRTS